MRPIRCKTTGVKSGFGLQSHHSLHKEVVMTELQTDLYGQINIEVPASSASIWLSGISRTLIEEV